MNRAADFFPPTPLPTPHAARFPLSLGGISLREVGISLTGNCAIVFYVRIVHTTDRAVNSQNF